MSERHHRLVVPVIIIVVRVGVRILALPVLGTLASISCSSLVVVAVVSVFDLVFLPAKILPSCHHREVTSWGPRRGIDRRKSLPQISPPQTCPDFFFFLSYIHYGGHFVHF